MREGKGNDPEAKRNDCPKPRHRDVTYLLDDLSVQIPFCKSPLTYDITPEVFVCSQGKPCSAPLLAALPLNLTEDPK